MTTQVARFGLYGTGPSPGRIMSATCTDDAFTEITSLTGTLKLDDVMKGTRITHASGQYAAGQGIGRIRNSVTNKVKGYIMMDVIGEERYRKLIRPITVEENDVLEAYTQVAT